MTALFSDPWVATDDDGNALASRPAIPIQVYKVSRSQASSGTMQVNGTTLLPNVACLAVEERIGVSPATAVFRYVFNGMDPQSPQNTEQALSTLYTTQYLSHLVESGDELAVLAMRPDGLPVWLFDGFVLAFDMKVDRHTDSVVMTAVGVAKRAWDTPIGGAVWRDSADPTTVLDIPTDRILQFNPGGIANASPKDADSGDDPFTYPVVMDPSLKDDSGNVYAQTFDLAMAAAHLIYLNNQTQAWIQNPKRSDLDDLLVSREPKNGVPFDPNNPSTYDAKPFAVTDTPMTDRAWPSAVHDLVKDLGFDVRWPLTSDNNGNPVTAFEVFLKQAASPKPLLLQARGSTFDPAQTNLGSADLSRDLSGVVNQWTVVGGLKRYEVSIILAPLFPSQASDVNSLKSYIVSDPAFATTDAYDAYRTWVLDEDGSGHYLNLSTAKVAGTATSLDAIFGAPAAPPGSPPGAAQIPTYVKRKRPPIGQLFQLDTNGKPLRYRVSLSKDYTGAYPAVWDGSGTWSHIGGGFELLKDRIGVRCTINDPNDLNVGVQDVFPGRVAKLVNCMAAPDGMNPAFFIRLTCVIEGDQALQATAKAQGSSPIATPIIRSIDARDRYALQTRSAHSEFNTGATDQTHEQDPNLRDDTDAATAEAIDSRTASEAGVMGGTAMVPYFTAAYEIGDRISEIQGRSLGLRTDTGGNGFAPVLPIVVARRWDLDGKQMTFLEISDSGQDRKRYGLRRSTESLHGSPVDPRAAGISKAKQVAANAAAIQKAGFGVATGRL